MKVNVNVFHDEGDVIKTGTLSGIDGARWEVWVAFAVNEYDPGTQVFLSEAEARDVVRQLTAELDGLAHDRERPRTPSQRHSHVIPWQNPRSRRSDMKIQWEKPPEGPVREDLAEFWAAIHRRPGRWAVYPGANRNTSQIRSRVREGGHYEAVQRNKQMYVRWVEDE